MRSLRHAARRLLRFVVRLAPPRSREWGDAMLGEMDAIHDDADALRWALGSVIALCRHSAIEYWRAACRPERSAGPRAKRREGPARAKRRLPDVITSVAAGIAAAALILTISTSTLATFARASWFEPGQGRLLQLLFAVVIPDALCVLGGAVLWRPQRRLAPGILAAGAALGAHSIIYFVA